MAVVGLGTGAVAAYAKPGQEWTFFEIDPAGGPDRPGATSVSFRRCRAKSCSDRARRRPAETLLAPDGSSTSSCWTRFSSDAIPVHLLTREAMRLYVQKLAPGGVLAMHVSNNHLDLPPLVSRLRRGPRPAARRPLLPRPRIRRG